MVCHKINKAQICRWIWNMTPRLKDSQLAIMCWHDNGHMILGSKRCDILPFTEEKYTVWSIFIMQACWTSRVKREKVKSLKAFWWNRTTWESCKIAMDAVERYEYNIDSTSCVSTNLAPRYLFLLPYLKKVSFGIISGLTITSWRQLRRV